MKPYNASFTSDNDIESLSVGSSINTKLVTSHQPHRGLVPICDIDIENRHLQSGETGSWSPQPAESEQK